MNSGDIIAARYVLDRPLARGGMGNVWVARHLALDIKVALKVLAPEHVDTPLARERFEREAKACAQIKSPHVVAVHDYGVADGAPFLVMELLEGEDLHAYLAREKRISPAAAISVLGPVCKGLRRAHELGIIHRDIKPSNIFITRQSDDPLVKILDFGVARMAHDLAGQATRTGTLLGSPCYMSPEQARGRHVDHRTDLWSLGIVLYECLTGRLPFLSQTLGDLLVELCTEPVPRPTTIAPDLPPAVDHFFERALARNPEERFQSVEAFATALHTLVIGSPNPTALPLFTKEATMEAAKERGQTVAMPAPPSPPLALSPTHPGIARTIAGNRPRAKVAVGILAALLLSLGIIVTYRLSQSSNPNEALDTRVAAPAELSSPISMQPAVPMNRPSLADAPVAEIPPPPSTSSAAKPTDALQTTRPTQARRPPPKNPVSSPPATRDPTFGF